MSEHQNDASRESDADRRVTAAMESYLHELDVGRRPDRDEFLARFPDIADALEEHLQGLDFIHQVAPQLSDAEGPRPLETRPLGALTTLGDFRIEGELGRGGMGVVYRAEQLSLGRTVALKVLPFAAMLDAKQLTRFKNEARAAASLDHPHIVPVHCVGSQHGVHFYAMQLIEGHTLAEVIHALRREQSMDLIGSAHSLRKLTAEFAAKRAGGGKRPTSSSAASGTPGAEQRSAVHALKASPPCGNSSSRSNEGQAAAAIDAPAGITNGRSSSSRSHFRAIARLGIQAARALEYAHAQGVIHRDIKPGNLMLDSHGDLYVTDFGLARIEADAGVTMSGDLLGTLRYMAPEQALAKRAPVDHRADIYSLGVTLYELSTLQPAVDGVDRQQLLEQIAFADPKPPRKLNRRIPVELETIVLKAMAKEPDQRYGTAGELADDLERFLAYKPIKARPPTLLEQVAKWSIRHQSLVWSCVTLTLMAAAAMAISTVIVLGQKAQTARALETAQEAVESKEKQLYVRTLSLAAEAWKDGDPRRTVTLLESSPAFEQRPDLRGFEWHYLTQLVLTEHDVLTERQDELFAARYSPDGKLIAIGAADGTIELWDAQTRRCRQVLRGHSAGVTGIDFHPDGHQLASASMDGTARIWPLSGTAAETEAITVIPANPGGTTFAICFSPEGKTLATAGDDDLVKLWALPSLRQQATLAGHTGDVRCLAFLEDEHTLASGSDDRTVTLWDTNTRRKISTLRGHSGMVLSLVFAPRERLLISGGNDATIRIWDVDHGLCVSTIMGHLDGVQALARLDDERLVSGDRGGTVRIWHLPEYIRVVDRYIAGKSVTSVALARDGATWAALKNDGRLVIRDVQSQQIQTFTITARYPPRFPVANNIAFSVDGQRLACTSEIYIRSSTGQWRHQHTLALPDGLDPGLASSVAFGSDASVLAIGVCDRVILWDVATGAQIANTAAANVKSLQFSPDGLVVAIGAGDGRLALWNWHTDSSTPLLGHSGDVHHVGFTRDGRQLVSFSGIDQTVRWWDTATGSALRSHRISGSPSDVDLSPDQSLLASTNFDGVARLWDTRGGRLSLRAELAGHANRIDSVQFSERGTELLTGVYSDDVILWDIRKIPEDSDAEGDYLQGHTDRVWSIDVSPDGQQLLTASRDGSARTWYTTRRESSWIAGNQHERIRDFAFAGRGSRFVVLDDSTVGCWDSGSDEGSVLLSHQAQARPVCVAVSAGEKSVAVGYYDGTVVLTSEAARSTLEIAAHTKEDGVDRLAFSPDGTSLVTSSNLGNQIRVWDTASGEMLADLHIDDSALAFSPDGRLLVCADGRDCVIADADSWQEIHRLSLHSITVTGVAFNRAGTILATSSEDRKIILWDTATWTPLHQINAHAARIESIAFSPDGRTLASGDREGTVKLWNVELGQVFFELERQPAAVIKLAFAPDGRQLRGQLDNGQMIAFEIR